MTLRTRAGILATLVAGAAAASNPPPDPFQALEDLRLALASRGAIYARFEQSFVPAGFSSGEVESGTVALDLPSCLRWDYLEPMAKSFLLCELELYSWNPGEGSGQLVALENAEQPGLDLLVLPRARLEALYSATWSASPTGLDQVELEPRDPDHSSIARATLIFDHDKATLDKLAWNDREGNRTTFLFTGWEACETCAGFVPPADITWEVRHAPK